MPAYRFKSQRARNSFYTDRETERDSIIEGLSDIYTSHGVAFRVFGREYQTALSPEHSGI